MDASQIDVKAMGQFSMGGFGGQNSRTDDGNANETADASVPDGQGFTPPDTAESTQTDSAQSESTSENTPTAGVHRQRPSFSGMPDRQPSG